MSSESKYREIERALRADIGQGRWAAGERMPSEHELSRRFGVSYMTTRQAVSLLVADGLVKRISGKGTFVVPRTDIVEAEPRKIAPMALVVPKLWQKIDPYYFPDVLDGFQSYVEDQGREVVVTDYATVEESQRIPQGAAVACLLTTTDETEFAEKLKDQGYIVLGINRYTGRRAIPWIAPDNLTGAAAATKRLVDLGHRRIGFLRGDLMNLDAIDRLKGYRQTMRRSELTTLEAGNGFREHDGYRAAMELLQTPYPPTAFVSASDLSALGAITAARELGLEVPRRISIIGFGNFSLISYLDPPLTTVDLPRTELGRSAARMLIAMAGGGAARSETIATTLVPGNTDAGPWTPDF